MNALERLNTEPAEAAKAELIRCCGSTRWAEGMVAARPFKNREALLREADSQWERTGPDDWLEAMTHHPRIGERQLHAKFAATHGWSSQEQQGVYGASEDVLRSLVDANRAYEERFGFVFLVCATGKSAAEMLELLRARMNNDRETELRVAAGEQAKITRLRLDKLLSE